LLAAPIAPRLGGFKVPKGVVFVDALPKNPSGKLLKRELRKLFETHYDVLPATPEGPTA
jgi:fatty-acyl-CoA synthase